MRPHDSNRSRKTVSKRQREIRLRKQEVVSVQFYRSFEFLLHHTLHFFQKRTRTIKHIHGLLKGYLAAAVPDYEVILTYMIHHNAFMLYFVTCLTLDDQK